MKCWLFFLSVILLNCHQDDPIIVKDFCPICTSSIEINGEDWPSKPLYAWFQHNGAQDTVFDVAIIDSFPKNDPFPDYLCFYRLPFDVGVYPLDDTLEHWNTDVRFTVYQTYDAPSDHYEPVNDGSGVITIESIDKTTGALTMSFDLRLYVNGNPNGESHNFTYPNLLEITGQVQVMVTKEE